MHVFRIFTGTTDYGGRKGREKEMHACLVVTVMGRSSRFKEISEEHECHEFERERKKEEEKEKRKS
jgi:hypothetical protein